MITRRVTFSSPEAVLLLVSTKNCDLWEGPTLVQVHDSQTCHQIWQIWLAEKLKQKLYAYSENWVQPEVTISGANQKDQYLSGRK